MNGSTAPTILLLALLLGLTAPAAWGHPEVAAPPTAFREVGTQVCSCGATAATGGSGITNYRPSQPFSAPIYDEQLGISFTQDFTAIAYNVTAVEQQDTGSGFGPAYLLNGVSSAGFWYQVGLSWNWNPGTTPGTGFDMNYEVFDTNGNSIFPTNGDGGLLALSGPVNEGDSVLLNLFFNSSGVTMLVHDWNTGASAKETFSAEGAASFIGTPSSISDSQGYFTGLMTEWYHTSVYLGNGAEVVFTDRSIALTSAWLWMDEYDPNPPVKGVFTNGTASPVSFTSNKTQLHEFASNGATEYANAFEFITGVLRSIPATPVPLTMAYSVEGGGSGYSAPVLEYVSGGADVNSTLTNAPATYNVDKGTVWNVSSSLPGSTSTERWKTGQPSSGTAMVAETLDLAYHHQYVASAAYSVVGASASPPLFRYTSLGNTESAPVNASAGAVWLDAGSSYSMTDPLPGSGEHERWQTSGSLNGTVTSVLQLSAVYYQQFTVRADFTSTGGSPPAPSMDYTAFGSGASTVLASSPQTVWTDAGSTYSLPPILGTGQQERWTTNATSGTVSGALTVSPDYRQQYYVTLRVGNHLAGNLSGSASGWHDAGSGLGVIASSSPGWKFEYWLQGNGTAITFLPSQVNGPMNETAVFYPQLTVVAGSGSSVSYSYTDRGAETRGTVPAGSSAGVWAPPGGVALVASPSSFLYSFAGWSGATNAANPSISLTVSAPETVSGGSGYNYLALGLIGGVVLVMIAVVASLARRGSEKEASGSPAA